MKIVFIGGRDIHTLGGIENYMYNLATELVKIGHEPIVFCESDHNSEEIVNGFRVIYHKERVTEPNEKIAYLRSCVIGALVINTAEAFVKNEEAILDGSFTGSLIDNIPELEHGGYRRCAELSYRRLYNSSEVVDIEIAGNRIITFLLEKLINAVIFQ